MQMETSAGIGMEMPIEIPTDSLTGITDEHELVFPDAYTDGNAVSSSDSFSVANSLDEKASLDMSALDQVSMIQDGTMLVSHAEQSSNGVIKTTASIGVQVNLCCCSNLGCLPSLGRTYSKQETDSDVIYPATTLKRETHEIDVKVHTGQEPSESKHTDTVKSAGEDLLLIATQKVFLKHSSKDAKRKDKKRRKAEKAARKPKQQKVLTRRSTKSTLERRFLCEGCGIRFVHKATYDRHLLELRGKASEHKCSYCEATFSFLCKLKQHIAAKHPELTSSPAKERPVICHVCGIQLQTSISMNKHMRIHDGDKPFVCKYCPKAFRWHTGLEYHERIHTGERPFKCPNCPKAFTNPSDMARHQTVHTGKKPHLCHQCGKGFTQSGTLNAHIKSKHTQLNNPLNNPTTNSNVNSTEFVTIPLEPKLPADIHVCHLCGRYFTKDHLLDAHIRKCHQQQTNPNLAIEGGMRCSTLEDMKLQLASCSTLNQNPVFNMPTCIPTEREIAEVVVNMLAQ